MKVAIRNFQAIKDATLQLEGLTVVTGRSNLGKSALARAIAWAFYGMPGDFFVSNGADRSAVGLKLSDGTLLEWYKVRQGKNTPGVETNIKVNGVKHTKIGREHQKLTEPLGVREIETTYAALRPQYAAQSDLPFLLSENPATVAELLQVLGHVDVVTEAQSRAKKDLKLSQSELGLRHVDLLEASAQLKSLDNTQDLRKRLDELKAQSAEIENRRDQVTLLGTKYKDYLSLEPKSLPAPVKVTIPPDLLRIDLLKRYLLSEPRPVPLLPTVAIPPEIGVVSLLRKYEAHLKEDGYLSTSKSELSSEIAALEEGKLQMEKELGLCPTCGRTFEN